MFSKSNKKASITKDKSHSWIYLTIAVVVIILAIIGVLYSPSIAEYLGGNSTLGSQSGVGGALGGITAPIIGLAGSILVFLSFWAQYQANQRQWGWIKRQEEEKEYERIQKLIKLIQTEHKDDIIERIGYYYHGASIVRLDEVTQFGDPDKFSNPALECIKKLNKESFIEDDFPKWMSDLMTKALLPFDILLRYFHALKNNSYTEIISIQIDKIIIDFSLKRVIGEMLKEIIKYEKENGENNYVTYLKLVLKDLQKSIDEMHSIEKYL